MGKTVNLIPFLFKPSCGNLKTNSFREAIDDESCWFTNSKESESNSCTFVSIAKEMQEEESSGNADYIENVIRGLRSERLFFEVGDTTSSILGKQAAAVKTTTMNITRDDDDDDDIEIEERNDFVVMELMLESSDPFMDFKRSMEEMVEAHELNLKKDNVWEGLEQLLNWYLRVNGKWNHEYIIGAFVDLLLDLHLDFISDGDNNSLAITLSPISASSSSSSSSSSSNGNSTTPGCSSSSQDQQQEEMVDETTDYLGKTLVLEDGQKGSSISDV